MGPEDRHPKYYTKHLDDIGFSLSFNFLICKIPTIIPASKGCQKDRSTRDSRIELKLNIPEKIPMGLENEGGKPGRDSVKPREDEEESC